MRTLFEKLLYKLPELLGTKKARILDRAIHEHYAQTDSLYPEHSHYVYWERRSHSWGKSYPPLRPSQGDIEIYSGFLEHKKQKRKILILGSTPELRDLVAQDVDVTVYVADFSHNMPSAMLKFTKHVDQLKEKWIKSNWLELPFPEKFFDIILGDVVLHQITPKLEPLFLQKMNSLLKDDGAFITRLFFLDSRFLQKDLCDIAIQTLAGPYSHEQKYTLLMLQAVWLFSDLDKRKFNRPLSEEKFKELMESGALHDPILRKVHDVLIADKDSYRDWSPPNEQALKRLLLSSFRIHKTKVANDYSVANYFPMFLLTPKR